MDIRKTTLTLGRGAFILSLLSPAAKAVGWPGTSPFWVQCFIFAAFLLGPAAAWISSKSFSKTEKQIRMPVLFYFFFLGFVVLQILFGRTIGRIASMDELLRHVFYFLFFLSALHYLADRKFTNLAIFFIALLVTGLVIVGYWDRQLLWGRSGGGLHALFSHGEYAGFVRDNDYGGFLTLATPLFLSYLFYWFSRDSLRRTHDPHSAEALFFILLVPIIVISTIDANARSAFLIQCLFVGVALVGAIFTGKGMKRRIFIGAMLIFLPLSVMAFRPEIKTQLIALAVRDTQGHFKLLVEGWNVFLQRPWSGWGLGSTALALYRCGFSTPLFPSDALGLLIETGIVGSLLFVMALGLLIFLTAPKILRDPSLWSRLMAVSALAACGAFFVLLAVQSYKDEFAVILLFLFQLALLKTSASLRVN